MTEVNEDILEFLNEMEQGGLTLDQALVDYGFLLENSEVEQAYQDWRDARLGIRKFLKRIARQEDLQEVEDLLD